uniref:F-box domain-containing protein n=1 Tax=Mycena chlorophos TaxID=658473 RepID=A0ABQ0M3Y8_MYCCL|nr:predicted protein [Mycena chlorophos]
MADPNPTLCSRCRMNLFRRSPLLPTPTQTAELDALLRSNLAAAAGFGTMLDDGAAESELARYATEIEGVQMRLQELILERDKLEEYISRVRSARTAHIRRLPQEILGEIQERCAPSLEEYKMRPGVVQFVESERERLAKLPLLNLAKVSSRWRQIIMKTPQLWATVVVDWHLWREYDEEVHMDLLSETLERSAHHALTVILLGPVNGYDCAPIRLLLQHASSWVHLLDRLMALTSFPSSWYSSNILRPQTAPGSMTRMITFTNYPGVFCTRAQHCASHRASTGSSFRQRSLNPTPIQAQIARLTLRLGPDNPQVDAASVPPVLFSDLGPRAFGACSPAPPQLRGIQSPVAHLGTTRICRPRIEIGIPTKPPVFGAGCGYHAG